MSNLCACNATEMSSAQSNGTEYHSDCLGKQLCYSCIHHNELLQIDRIGVSLSLSCTVILSWLPKSLMVRQAMPGFESTFKGFSPLDRLENVNFLMCKLLLGHTYSKAE